MEAINAANRLVSRLRTPVERCYHEFSFSQSFVYATVKTLMDIGLWEAWFIAGGGDKSLDELVKLARVDIDTNLLQRLCRLMVSVYVIDEVAEGRYKPTELSLFFGNGEVLGPEQFQARIQHFKRASVQPWKVGLVQRSPGRRFTNTTSLIDGADLDGPLVVDVGGNIGNDISRFLAKHPDVPAGSLVLQDRPEALKIAKVDQKIKIMPHDFFTPQPVKGSRAYFFHAVFHDWPDEEAVQILQNITPAMKKGYSRLLICDITLPPVGATATQAAIDVAYK
ncbi:O-methyltransferase-domain-containing protein [Xylariales sp. AK1849]|nr:O-methyltransferase-domain-containing protein [Xylariales sp. AK1849]